MTRTAPWTTLRSVQVGFVVGGKYRILGKLGEGGMGSVWLARNEVTEREFAIKFLHPGAANAAQLKRFFQEAKVAGRLRHPSIVEIFDAGTDPELDDSPYLVMELLDGVGLDDAIARAGKLPVGLSVEIIAEISRALALAHAQGIIHRDLKPSNVFLHRIGTGALVPKVLDFGISKVLTESPSLGVTTRTGAVMGSPLYMSPEQAAGDKTIDARSDVHSLGVMLWECLVGKPPFLAETYGLLMVQIIQEARPRLADAAPGTPASVCDIVQRAMSKERGQRYAEAGELADALERVMAELGHRPLLSERSGDAQFFALLAGKPLPVGPRPRSSTTGAMEVPRSTPGVVDATSAEQTREMPESIHIPQRRASRAVLAISVLGVFGAMAVGGFAWMRNRAPAGPESEGTSGAADAAALVATTTAPVASAADAAAPTPSVEPSADSDTSATASAEVAPPSARPSTVKPHSGKPPVAKTTADKPPTTAAPTPTGKPPVHHGITSSGL